MCSLLAKVMFCLYLSHLTRLSIPLTYIPLPPNVEQSAAPLFHSEIKRRKEKETPLEQVSCVEETCVQGTLTYCTMQTKGESESEIGMGEGEGEREGEGEGGGHGCIGP